MRCQRDKGDERYALAGGAGSLMSLLCLALLAACGSGGGGEAEGPTATATTLTWDSANEAWVAASRSAEAVAGSPSRSEVEVDLPANEAVKLISAREVQLVDSFGGGFLELAGRDDLALGTRGDIVICKLVVKKVDIEELIIDNVQASRVTVVDFAADDGLGVDVVPVNVIRCGRGGVGVVALGVESTENEDLFGSLSSAAENLVRPASSFVFPTDGKQGARLNEVRILGPEGKDAFVETIVLERSSVFGLVLLRNLKIKELIVESVTVDRRNSVSGL